MILNKKFQSFIFNKNINVNTKLIPFNTRENYLGKIQYFPAASKEWKNNVYFFNINNIKNFPVYDLYLNRLIKGYFNLYLNHKQTITKYKSSRVKRLSFNKIFVSKGELQHANSKVVITINTYNREKISILKKINKLIKYNKIYNMFFLIGKKSFIKKFLFFFYKGKKLYKNINLNFYNKAIKLIFYKKLIIIRRYIIKLNLNKFKFEEKFLYRLSKLISKLYKKKVEFNIINLKSIVLNTDLFTEILTLKLKKKRIHVIRMMNIILNKVRLPKVNRLKERTRIIKSIDFNLLENKYKNYNINSIFKKGNFNTLFNELYDKYNNNNISYKQNTNIFKDKNQKSIDLNKVKYSLFNRIKYKNVGGIRLEISGRLTRRYRADRSIFKLRWKGGLKNIDSSFKGLSSVKFRGFVNPNVQYSLHASKRRIGSFAVKGWISGT